MAGYFLVPEIANKYLSLIPRNINGIIGILTMPFIHGSIQHLMSNIIPIALMLGLLSGVNKRPIKTLFTISVLGGVILWLFGRDSTSHVGASVLLFGLASYLIVSGIKARKPLNIAASMIVVILYGVSLAKGVMPAVGVSWDGHLCGFIAGVIVALKLDLESVFSGKASSNT